MGPTGGGQWGKRQCFFPSPFYVVRILSQKQVKTAFSLEVFRRRPTETYLLKKVWKRNRAGKRKCSKEVGIKGCMQFAVTVILVFMNR